MPRDDQVLYRKLAESLRRQIQNGELQPGNQLPSERALEGLHHVSRNTVRLALDALIKEGLVTSSQGKGYFVRERAPLPYYGLRLDTRLRGSSEDPEVWKEDVRQQGKDPSTELTVTAAQQPPAEVTAALELGETDKIIKRQRTNYVDGVPYAIALGYYPVAVVKDSTIAKADDIEPEEILAELGHQPETYVDRVVTRMPTPDEQRALQLEPGTPISDFMRTGYDGSGRPVRTQVTTLPGDRFTIVYEMPAH